jgi:transcriptional/translational regulatory protein YebC/TACO1
MGSVGSVAYLFDRKGEIRVPLSALGEEAMLEAALEAGADDVNGDGDDHVIHTTVESLFEVASALARSGIESSSQKLVFVPKSTTSISDATIAAALIKLSDALDDYDDTQNIYSNFDFTDEVMATLDA